MEVDAENAFECYDEPCAKRRRIGSHVYRDSNATALASTLNYPNFHQRVQGKAAKRFWFHDGDILFRFGREYAFKVHRQKLADCSDFFVDVFQLPQPLDKDTFEGCAVIEQAEEDLGGWSSVFGWLYSKKEFVKELHDFPTIAAVTRLSHKYQIDELHEWAVSQLYRHFPPTQIFQLKAAVLPQAVDAILLARECSVEAILPAAFYALSVYTDTIHAKKADDTPEPHMALENMYDLERLISGREKLALLHNEILVRPLARIFPGEDGYDEYCPGCVPALENDWRQRFDFRAGVMEKPRWLLDELAQVAHYALTSAGEPEDAFTPGRPSLACPGCVMTNAHLALERMVALERIIPKFFMLED